MTLLPDLVRTQGDGDNDKADEGGAAGGPEVDFGAGGIEVMEERGPDSGKPRKTTKYMTKYERARVLGARALQIR